MKILKRKMLYSGVIALAGAVMLAVSLLTGGDSYFGGMGGALLAVGLAKVLQYLQLGKDPQKVRELEIAQHEERLVFLAAKSCQAVFYLSILAEYAAMMVLAVLHNTDTAALLGFVVCAQLLAYLGFRAYYNRRY